MLPASVQAYLLGFHLEIGIPHVNILKTALQNLSKKGPGQYIADMKDLPRPGAVTPVTGRAPAGMEEFKLGNTQDAMLNDITSYSPFDRIYYTNGTHLYCFTRVEFDSLIKDRKNPWTKEPIPEYIIELIQCRLNMSKSLQLPPCEPLHDLYEKVIAGKLSLVQTKPSSPDMEELFGDFLTFMMMSR